MATNILRLVTRNVLSTSQRRVRYKKRTESKVSWAAVDRRNRAEEFTAQVYCRVGFPLTMENMLKLVTRSFHVLTPYHPDIR